jgi:twitching motility two-component system response regulator PilG
MTKQIKKSFPTIGYINLKEYRKGFEYLQEAVKKNPSDVILTSQIDALAIRLAEIEESDRDEAKEVKSKRILVVDDSPTVRKLISGKLEKCGHEAICAVDGMDALEKINEVIPDLILLDIAMPRMDGYQVCKLIRGNDATKDVPVVMISGKDGFFDKVRGRMAGTSNYITKPFGPETLMKTVNEYIQ